jgi:hypothetical protein
MLYRNIEQIKIWQEYLEEDQAIIFRTIALAEEFRTEFDTEIVMEVTNTYLDKAWTIFSDISSYLPKIQNYVHSFTEYTRNPTNIGGKELFDSTEKFLVDIEHWSEKVSIYNEAFLNLTVLMYKYEFKYP